VRSRELVFPALNFELDLHGHRDGDMWMPAEMPCSIRCPTWFWQAGDDKKVLSPEKLFQKYLTSVGRGAALLLNLTPDNRGQIPAADVQALRGFRRILDETFRQNFAGGATLVASNTRSNLTEFAAANCIDGSRDTCWSTDDGVTTPELTLEFSQPTTFNLVSLREFLSLGQRIDAFALDEWKNGRWVEFARATSIGNRRLLLVPDVTTAKVRLRITQASDSPALSEIGLFKVAKLNSRLP
jgi:alpha-L-fucosidase